MYTFTAHYYGVGVFLFLLIISLSLLSVPLFGRGQKTKIPGLVIESQIGCVAFILRRRRRRRRQKNKKSVVPESDQSRLKRGLYPSPESLTKVKKEKEMNLKGIKIYYYLIAVVVGCGSPPKVQLDLIKKANRN